MSRYSDNFDYFKFLDKTLKTQNFKNPVPENFIKNEKKN